MASKIFWDTQSGEREAKFLFGNFTITANGAVDAEDSNDFSLKLTGDGEYTATLNDRYNKLLFADAKLLDATNKAHMSITSEDVDAATPVVVFTSFKDNAVTGIPAAVDLATGDKLFVMIVVKNSNVTP